MTKAISHYSCERDYLLTFKRALMIDKRPNSHEMALEERARKVFGTTEGQCFLRDLVEMYILNHTKYEGEHTFENLYAKHVEAEFVRNLVALAAPKEEITKECLSSIKQPPTPEQETQFLNQRLLAELASRNRSEPLNPSVTKLEG